MFGTMYMLRSRYFDTLLYYTIDIFHAAVLDVNYEAGIVGSYHVPTECDR